ncbi:hypothetical protein [Thalassotalea hakodatensis]|uniref:hypothetical protein n=1 Tax=Thalassotalea hakodatensis TaxID=3030492 RepID=UPI00257234F8|nr:hypothetical protein [Thalassotalea hakodatensis]
MYHGDIIILHCFAAVCWRNVKQDKHDIWHGSEHEQVVHAFAPEALTTATKCG